MRRETIAHILHLQSHHPVHLLMMLMLAAHPFVTDESDESQHAHYQQADNQEQDDSKDLTSACVVLRDKSRRTMAVSCLNLNSFS